MQRKIPSTKHKLHSIPISKLKNNVLYSISCVATLLLSISSLLSISNYAYADDWYDVVTPPTDTTPTASLTLTNPSMKSEPVSEGGIATVSTDITVDVKNAESYSLTISFDNTTLTNGDTTITAGDAANTNTWGYKWDAETAYTAPTTSSKELATPALVSDAINFTKTLTFAAKFGTNADPGAYHASGNLKLVAAPKVVTAVYTLTYNIGRGSNAPSNQTCNASTDSCNIGMSYTSPTNAGNNFLGWADTNNATSANLAYSNGATISMTGDKTLYAVWQPYTIELTYDANGGSNAPSGTQCHPSGNRITCDITITSSEPTPPKGGSTYYYEYVFDGWKLNQTSDTPDYTSGSTITISEPTTLYAHYKIEI